MRILVCLKQVPDTTEVKMSDEFTLERDFIAQIINPADESALELGLKLRDQQGGSVTVVTMGPARTETMLREVLARGADEAVLMTDRTLAGADTLVTAKCLCRFAEKQGGYDLILCGRRAADGETGQVGPMLASMLNIACVANATDVRLNGENLAVDQLTEDGMITWEAHAPALVTLCEWSHRLRLPTIAGLRNAGKAVLQTLTAADLDLSPADCGLKASPTRVTHISARPAGVRPCRKVSVDQVLPILQERRAKP